MYTFNPLNVPIFRGSIPSVYDDSMSYSEQVGALYAKINEVGNGQNDNYNDLVDYIGTSLNEVLTRISTEMKLSPTGDFTGTINGESMEDITNAIRNVQSTYDTLIAMINENQAVEGIIDGGGFTDSSYVDMIDGGEF